MTTLPLPTLPLPAKLGKFTVTFDPDPEPPFIPEEVFWAAIGFACGMFAWLAYSRFLFPH